MGGLQRSANGSGVQSIRLSTGIYAAGAYWNGNLYTFASEDSLKQFAVTNGRVALTYSAREQTKVVVLRRNSN